MSNRLEAGQQARAIADYEAAYPHPIAIAAGERLVVGRRDQEWPSFVWCTNCEGRAGWVPESYLGRQGDVGVARCDYTARELTVSAGQLLTVERAEGGWVWATDQAGQSGWVPEKVLAAVGEA